MPQVFEGQITEVADRVALDQKVPVPAPRGVRMEAGIRLREAREQRGLTLRDISNVTKIPLKVLDTIESNDTTVPGGLPGPESVPSDFAFVSDGVQLRIHPSGTCLVSATADGRPVISRLVQPGENVLVEGHDEIVLRVGDAGACGYSINEKPGIDAGAAVPSVDISTPDVAEPASSTDLVAPSPSSIE